MLDLQHSFPGQEQDEVVYIFARPYFLAFVPTVLLFLVAFLFAFFIQYVALNNILFTFTPSTSNAIILFMGIFQLIALIIFLVAALDFYFDIFIVTNQRIVDIDQNQLFSRPISELNLEEVEDVRSEVTGIFPTFFNYGTVIVETAAEQNYFVAPNLRFPREITAIVNDLSQQAKQDIEEGIRRPRTTVLGLINNQPIASMNELAASGAIAPEDIGRFPAIASPTPPPAPDSNAPG